MKSRCQPGHALSDARGESVPCFLSALGVAGSPWIS